MPIPRLERGLLFSLTASARGTAPAIAHTLSCTHRCPAVDRMAGTNRCVYSGKRPFATWLHSITCPPLRAPLLLHVLPAPGNTHLSPSPYSTPSYAGLFSCKKEKSTQVGSKAGRTVLRGTGPSSLLLRGHVVFAVGLPPSCAHQASLAPEVHVPPELQHALCFIFRSSLTSP